ncbi:MAG: hypothetical protein P4L31_00560 [Candidatus Babeliales bacterium]|nr:hypothetical protein [Candidatus Babeliales bacterium]
MEQEQYTREQIIIIILLCLLLHILFVGIFFFWQHSSDRQDFNLSQQYEKRIEQLFEKQTKEPLTPQEEKELFEWVNGQEKGNASILFDDNIQDEQGQPDGDQQGNAIEMPTEETPTDKNAEPAPDQAVEEKLQDAPEPKELESPKEKIEDKDATTTMPISPKELPQAVKTQAQKITPADKPKKVTEQKMQDDSRQSVTLADITKGLVQKMSNSSDHLVNAINGKDGKVTQEQLRYERYFKKISYHFTNSDKIHRSNHIDALMKARDQIRSSMNIQIALNRDGSILDVRLASSCGSKVIDDYYMFVFKDASSSFPTVPSFLPAPLRFGYTIGVQQHAQQSTSPIRFTMS